MPVSPWFYEADTISIKRIEQTNQSDCEFYNKLVTDYGLVLKIYDNRLVVFSEAQYEAKAAKLTLTEADFEPGWSWDTTLEAPTPASSTSTPTRIRTRPSRSRQAEATASRPATPPR